MPMMHECPVEGCGSRFFDTTLLGSHVETVHPDHEKPDADVLPFKEPTKAEPEPSTEHYRTETNHVCQVCGKVYRYAKSLENHMEKGHDAEPETIVPDPPAKPKRKPRKKATKRKAPAKPKVFEGADEDLDLDPPGGEGPWILVVEVDGGVTIRLHAESKTAYDLACAAADRHGIPYH